MIDFLTAGEKRHSNKKAERNDMKNAESMKDYDFKETAARGTQTKPWRGTS
jgi:hypothetical protein